MRYINCKKVQGSRRLKGFDCKALDNMLVLAAARETGAIMTIEEHNVIGGLGSVTVEIMAENNITTPLHRLCVPEFIGCVGSQKALREFYGIDVDGIVEFVVRC